MLLQARHYTVRSYSPSRRGPMPRIAFALGTLGMLGAFVAGGAWLVAHFRLGVPMPVSTLVIQDDYDGAPVAGAQVTVLPLTCPKGACVPKEMSAQGPVGHAFDTNMQGQVRVQLPGERAVVSISRQGYDTRQPSFHGHHPRLCHLRCVPPNLPGASPCLASPSPTQR